MKTCGNTWKAAAFSQLPSPSYHFQALRMSGLINKLFLIFSVTTGCTMKSSPNMGTPRILQQSQDMTLFCRSWAKACAAVALKATGQENRCPCQGMGMGPGNVDSAGYGDGNSHCRDTIPPTSPNITRLRLGCLRPPQQRLHWRWPSSSYTNI